MADTNSSNGTIGSATPVLPVEGANIAADQVTNAGAATDGLADAKTRFGKAIEEAKAGAAALKDEALGRTAAYKDKASSTASDWQEQATAYANQAAALTVQGYGAVAPLPRRADVLQAMQA